MDWCPGALFNRGRVTNIYVGNRNIIDSDNGLSPGQQQAIIYTKTEILTWNRTLGDILRWNCTLNLYIFIPENTFKSVVYEMAAILSRPQCVHQMFTNNVTVFLYQVYLVVCAYNLPKNIKFLLWFSVFWAVVRTDYQQLNGKNVWHVVNGKTQWWGTRAKNTWGKTKINDLLVARPCLMQWLRLLVYNESWWWQEYLSTIT